MGKGACEDVLKQGFAKGKLDVARRQERSQPLARRVSTKGGDALRFAAPRQPEEGIRPLDALAHQRQGGHDQGGDESADDNPHPIKIRARLRNAIGMDNC